jgi:serine/threonine protein kinase
MCQHPNIIKLVDFFETNEQYYIVLDYMKGGDLFDYLSKRGFNISEDRAKHIAY